MRPPPGTATEEDVLSALEAPRKRLCELIDGVLVEKCMGFRESRLAVILIRLLDTFVNTHHLGIVTAPDGTIRLWAGRVRIPDVAFTSWESLPDRRLPTEPIPELAPDLAIEILSRGNTPEEMALKRLEYFTAGVRRVWEVDPQRHTVRVFSTPKEYTELTEADTLDGAPVLPGFTMRLGDLFAELEPAQ
jgi:Uma2 family endonuclease